MDHYYMRKCRLNRQAMFDCLTTLQIGLGLAIIGPWVLIILYDVLLYLWRTFTYEIPVVGGRARGRARPRTLTLTERAMGDPRALGLIGQTTERSSD